MISTSSSFILILATLLLSYIPQAASCPSIVTDYNGCSADAFGESSSLAANCTADNANVTVTGTINITVEFDPEAEITAVPCVSAVYCYEKYSQAVGKFCDLVEDREDGEDCGTPGIYTVKEATYPIPDGGTIQSVIGMTTFRLLMGYEESCSTAKTAFPWLYGWSVLPLAGVAWHLRQRQRRRPLLVLEDVSRSFVEMKDVQRIGSMV